jgi:lauroyl/myristoyl acyltransferase
MLFPESPVRDAWRLLAWGPWPSLVTALPPGWEVAAHRALGGAALRVASEARRRIEDNVHRALGDGADAARIAREAFGTHFAHQYLPVSFPRIREENAFWYLRIEGLDRLDVLRRTGRGAVLVHPHMGPVQLPLCVMGVLGYPMHQVGGGRVEGLSRTGRWAAARRRSLEEAMPVLVHDGRAFLRPVLRALQGGGIVMATCDGTGGGQEIGRRVVRPVFGHPMRIAVGPAWLAWHAGVPLLPLVTHPSDGPGPAWTTTIGEPLPLPREATAREALERGADLLAAFLEDSVRRWPGQWHFWDQFEPGRFLVEEPL